MVGLICWSLVFSASFRLAKSKSLIPSGLPGYTKKTQATETNQGWLVGGETNPLKNISQNRNLPQMGLKIHHIFETTTQVLRNKSQKRLLWDHLVVTCHHGMPCTVILGEERWIRVKADMGSTIGMKLHEKNSISTPLNSKSYIYHAYMHLQHL